MATPTEEPAPDINEPAWDPARDSPNERRSLLRELDPLPLELAHQRFVPELRTRDSKPLGERARLLLLGCTTDDLEVIANDVNADTGFDDDAEVEALRAAVQELESLLGRFRVLRCDSDERTIARMPVAERRHARQLQNAISQLEAVRYDGSVLLSRQAEQSVRRTRH